MVLPHLMGQGFFYELKNMSNINGYELSRNWFDFCFENPEIIKPIHSAIFFFAVEHCNRLGWKEKFGFPSQMVMEALGVKNWRTYSKALNDLVDFGFIKMIEISKNQYSSNIIAIVKNTKAHTKALDKALSKHSTKHIPKQGTKQGQSTVSIDKQYNKEQLNKEQITRPVPDFFEFETYAKEKASEIGIHLDEIKLKSKYLAWKENGWKTLGKSPRKIKNWKATLTNSLEFLKKEIKEQPTFHKNR